MKYDIVATSVFKKNLKIIKKRHKNLQILDDIVTMLANNEKLPAKYKDHQLINNGKYKDC